jgi:hypothetical protein
LAAAPQKTEATANSPTPYYDPKTKAIRAHMKLDLRDRVQAVIFGYSSCVVEPVREVESGRSRTRQFSQYAGRSSGRVSRS